MKKKYVVLVAATMLCGLMTVSAAAESESVTITDQLGREVTVNLPVESCYLGFYYEELSYSSWDQMLLTKVKQLLYMIQKDFLPACQRCIEKMWKVMLIW